MDAASAPAKRLLLEVGAQGGRHWIERRDGVCRVLAYKEDLVDEIEVYFMEQGNDALEYYDDEHNVSWLTQPLLVTGVQGSQMVR